MHKLSIDKVDFAQNMEYCADVLNSLHSSNFSELIVNSNSTPDIFSTDQVKLLLSIKGFRSFKFLHFSKFNVK